MRRILTFSSVTLLGALCLWPSSCATAPGDSSMIAAAWRSGRVEALPGHWDEDAWVGEDLCLVCHADSLDEVEATQHAVLLTGEDGWGCEACHGPGAEHEATEDPGLIERFDGADAVHVAGLCARCHFEDLRLFDAVGGHEGADELACIACHRVHSTAPASANEVSCLGCHATGLANDGDAHHADIVRAGETRACATCHVGGDQHAASLGGSATIGTKRGAELEAACASCHADASSARWSNSTHARQGISCLDCHAAVEGAASPISEPERCGSCHADAVASFRMPNRHPVLEGTLQCSSCHDVHTERRSAVAALDVERRCTECHRDVEGPFLFEHEADRFDGCGACHEPHGSPNRRLMRMTPVRNLCLSCHSVTPANHDQSAFSPFRPCISCHTEIHGSDHDSRFFR